MSYSHFSWYPSRQRLVCSRWSLVQELREREKRAEPVSTVTGPNELPSPATKFYVGVDTHIDTHTVAILDAAGRTLETSAHAATPHGYQDVIDTLKGLGDLSVIQVGVEGTNSYGAGLTRALQDSRFEVFEVLRPTRQVRRMDGKSDPIDAVEAARTLMSGRGISVPKSGVGAAESLRHLNVARNQHVSMMTALSNAILALLVTASAQIREKYRANTTRETLRKLRNSRPRPLEVDSVDYCALTSLKTMARTHQTLALAAEELEERMRVLLEVHYPALLQLHGAGTITAATLAATAGDNPKRIRNEAAFAKMCGACPIPASSGRTDRHRLNRGGNRQANKALHQIAVVRMSNHEPTRQYVERQIKRGKAKPEILRQLKRALCRSVYRALTNPHELTRANEETPHLTGKNLRKTRNEKGLTQAQVAAALDTNPTLISNIETESRPLPKLRVRYYEHLKSHGQTMQSKPHEDLQTAA